MSTLEKISGHLNIQLSLCDAQVQTVQIESTRPLHITRLFNGKPLDANLQTLPLLYNVCQQAQACAGVQACEQALGIIPHPSQELARQMLVLAETSREHAWRLLLDWRPLFGQTPLVDSMRAFMNWPHRLRESLFGSAHAFQIGGADLRVDAATLNSLLIEYENWLKELLEQPICNWEYIETWSDLKLWLKQAADCPSAKILQPLLERDWGTVGNTPIHILPELPSGLLAYELSNDQQGEFVRQPSWEGKPRETTSLTRQLWHPLLRDVQSRFGNGLMTRLLARLLELVWNFNSICGLAERLTPVKAGSAQANQSSGEGIAQVEAARGRLVHRVVQEQGNTVSWQILAPTEWNFHPQGVLAQSLKNLNGRALELETQVRCVINAVDPCVAYQLCIEEK